MLNFSVHDALFEQSSLIYSLSHFTSVQLHTTSTSSLGYFRTRSFPLLKNAHNQITSTTSGERIYLTSNKIDKWNYNKIWKIIFHKFPIMFLKFTISFSIKFTSLHMVVDQICHQLSNDCSRLHHLRAQCLKWKTLHLSCSSIIFLRSVTKCYWRW